MKELYYKKVAGSTFTDYTYDKNGNLITAYAAAVSETSTLSVVKTETVNGVMTEYTYNELNQLTGQVSEDSETLYLYDERGNQIHAETINEDESVSTVDMEYSVMGEMTSRTEKTGANTTLAQTNVYDQNGQRIKRTQDGTARNYYYDSGVVLYIKDGGTVSSANILSDNGAAIGTYRGSAYHTYLKDAQGSTTNLVKSDGTLTAAYDYTDFGETTELAGANFDNQIRYTGGIYDEDTGLYYLNARYYDPETGRFISQDSYRGEIDDPGQWHLYAYCANNPINYVDPSGHWKTTRTNNFRRFINNKIIFSVTMTAKWKSRKNNTLIKKNSVEFISNVETKNNSSPRWTYKGEPEKITVARNSKAATITKKLKAYNRFFGMTVSTTVKVVMYPKGTFNWSTTKNGISIEADYLSWIMTFL